MQGIVGSIPWSGMVFLTLYFQLLGMSDFAASLQMALLLGSTALGGLLGGWIGDKAAQKYPDHGRILVCQFSVAVGIPFSLTITKARSTSHSQWTGCPSTHHARLVTLPEAPRRYQSADACSPLVHGEAWIQSSEQ